jgi:hypothetical protein
VANSRCAWPHQPQDLQIPFLLGLYTEPALSLGRGLFMSFNRLFASFLVSVAMLCSLASTAGAQVTYTYTGNNFASFTADPGPFDTTNFLSATVTLTSQLANNLNGVSVDLNQIECFGITEGVRSLNKSTPAGVSNFVVSTDGSGNIVDWSFVVGLGLSGGLTTIESCGGGGIVTLFCGNPRDTSVIAIGGFAVSGSIFNSPGSWSLAPASDTDCDGVDDTIDNCSLIPNANGFRPPGYASGPFCDAQEDANGDGFGNACDADFDGDGPALFVSTTDWALLLDAASLTPQIPPPGPPNPPGCMALPANHPYHEYDLNCDGQICSAEGGVFHRLILQPPGTGWYRPTYP